MKAKYERLSNSRVARDGDIALRRFDVATFTRHAVSRRLKGQGVKLMRTLDDFGQMQYTWQVVHFLHRPGDHTATMRSQVVGDETYALWCEGPQADEVMRRVNYAVQPKILKRTRRRIRERINATKKQHRLQLKRERNDARKARPKLAPTKKRKTVQTRALLTLRRNKVAPQFKRSRDITWHEAVRAVGTLFEVKATALITTQECTDYRLRRALERNQLAFASITKEGFTIRFDLVTNWRGDLTRLRISFTDDNKHPLNRRARDYFKKLLMGKTHEQEVARLRLSASLEADMIKIAA